MTKIVCGDTVLIKHPVVTDNKWKKGKVIWHRGDKYSMRYNIVDSDSYYEIRFSDEGRLIIGDINNPYWADINIIKVDSNFDMGCLNCKHCDKCGYQEPCSICGPRNSRWEPCDSLKNKDKLNGNDILKGGYKLNYLKNRIEHCINTESDLAEFMADFNKKENKNMKKQQKKRDRNIIQAKSLEVRKIKEIMFNGPATIIKWEPTTIQISHDIPADKTVTVCKEPDKFDKTTGFLLAVLKELVDNQSYGNILEKIDEINKVDEEDLKPKYNGEAYKYDNKDTIHHCSIKDLKEATEALENAYHPGSVVKYKNGKKYYKVLCYRFDEGLKEMVYILQTYKGTCFMDINLKDTRKGNVPHSKLIEVRRK